MKEKTLTNRESRKLASKRYIMTLIHGEEAVSQTAIIEKTKIRPGTVQAIIEELLEEKMIRVKGEGESKGGRRPILLEINPDAHLTIGVDIDEERIEAGIVDFKGRILKQVSRIGYENKNREDFFKSLTDIIRNLIGTAGTANKILGIGVGVPGFVDRKTGSGVFCSYFDWWRDVPIKTEFEASLNIPVHIDNDTVVATLGEKWFGVGRGVENFLYIDIGETVGMGIVIQGQFYYGAGGNAGELGHTVISKNGPLCICGNEGCVEALASGMALKKEAQTLVKKGVHTLIANSFDGSERLRLETIIEAAKKGDKVAYQLVSSTAHNIGLAISNMINVFNPGKIILGGPIMAAEKIICEAVSHAIKSYSLPLSSSNLEVVSSQLREKAGILGASTLVTKQFFDFN